MASTDEKRPTNPTHVPYRAIRRPFPPSSPRPSSSPPHERTNATLLNAYAASASSAAHHSKKTTSSSSLDSNAVLIISRQSGQLRPGPHNALTQSRVCPHHQLALSCLACTSTPFGALGLWGMEEPICAAADEPGRDKLERVYDKMESLEGRVWEWFCGEMPGVASNTTPAKCRSRDRPNIGQSSL
jgi:hypothetical protein